MTISDRIFELMKQKNIKQKDFSTLTGIPQSTISDWKKKSTNPASDKIMAICEALDVTPYYLLTGIEAAGTREYRPDYKIIDNKTDEGILLDMYGNLDEQSRQRLLGYISALSGR